YLRIDGELYDFTLTVNRKQRALEGNIDKVNETVVVTASRDYLSASLKDVFGKATQGGYRLASANATSANASENVSANPTNPLGVYDFVVSDGSVYRTETEERGNSTFVVANRVQKSSLFDSLSTSVGDIPSPERGQIRGAIENGKTLYKQPAGNLRSYKFVEHQGNYYLMTYSKKSPSMLEVLDTPNIVGMLLGVIVLLGGFWQMYDFYRDKV
ncbi:MAG: hypothetical protein SV760_00145, partial [Halobacteria archaeon]|nr:hypothetical protein [Halobacteria archaeon]